MGARALLVAWALAAVGCHEAGPPLLLGPTSTDGGAGVIGGTVGNRGADGGANDLGATDLGGRDLGATDLGGGDLGDLGGASDLGGADGSALGVNGTAP
jgi:hypothetical protein